MAVQRLEGLIVTRLTGGRTSGQHADTWRCIFTMLSSIYWIADLWIWPHACL